MVAEGGLKEGARAAALAHPLKVSLLCISHLSQLVLHQFPICPKLLRRNPLLRHLVHLSASRPVSMYPLHMVV